MTGSPEWAKNAEVDLMDIMDGLNRVANYVENRATATRLARQLRTIASDVNDVVAEVQRA